MNVYALGAAFLKFKQILPFNLKAVDPALYIPRFAARLEFGSHEEEQKVCTTFTNNPCCALWGQY